MIGGSITAQLKRKTSGAKNSIGEATEGWQTYKTITGWNGLQSGDSYREKFSAKVPEATHVFLCDYDSDVYALQDEDCRLVINNKVYDVVFIDNPDDMDQQLEIYTKFVGGQV